MQIIKIENLFRTWCINNDSTTDVLGDQIDTQQN